MTVYVAVDLGIGAETTSLVVIERRDWECLGGEKVWRNGSWHREYRYRDPATGNESPEYVPPDFHLRHAERMVAGTPYPYVVARVKTLARDLREPTVVVDATGVGTAAIELFRKADVFPYVVTITAGEKVEEEGSAVRVPKRDVISAAVVTLQTGRLKIARNLPHGDLLVRELQTFRMNVDLRKSGDVLSWREGTNDDLVLALAVGLWMADRNVGAAWDALVEDEEEFRREHPFYDPSDFTGIFSGLDPDEL